MTTSTDFAIFILMISSLLVLLLEVIGNRLLRIGVAEKPHIRLLALSTLIGTLIMIFLDLISQNQLNQKPFQFINNIASIFLLINTIIAVLLGKRTLAKNQNGEIYFLILSALALAISNINNPSLILKLITGTGWLILMTTLAIRTTSGGKRAEIGLKLSFGTIIFITLLMVAIWLLDYSYLPANLHLITLDNTDARNLGFIALILLSLASLTLAGIPPFHFGHIDCGDGGNISAAFLLMGNSFIQSSVFLLDIKTTLVRSGLNIATEANVLSLMLIFGFMVLWLRALDQNKIRRTAAYIAGSLGPLFFMSILFGTSVLLPKLIFVLAIFSFVTLTLFTLYGSLAYMDALNLSWQTWEEMSGFGRINPWPTLTFLIAISSIAGLPGTLGYFVKLSLIAPLKDSIIFSGLIFLSIAIGAACVMRIFVFMFSKQSQVALIKINIRPSISLITASLILIALGFFPFVH